MVPFVEYGVRPRYILGWVAFKAWAALQVYEPWELSLGFFEVRRWRVVCGLLGF